MPYGLQDCSSGSNHSYPSSHSQARDFSLARYSRIAQVLIDKEVVFSTSLQHFLKPSLGCASLNLWAFSPSAPATSLELKPLPSGFHRSRGCGAFGFLFPPPPAACFRFAAGAGAFVVGACARTYYVFETHITDILILLCLYNSFVIYTPPHIRAGGKIATIACKAAKLRRVRFLCAARKITIETENRRKTHLRRRGERHKKSPPQKAGGGG